MKYAMILIFGMVLIFLGIFIFQQSAKPVEIIQLNISPTPIPITQLGKEVSLGDKKYRYFSQIIDNDRTFKLINNLVKKNSAELLMKQNNCRIGINGGFYDTNDRPLGLLIAEGVTIRKEINSNLFNGFIYSVNEKKLLLGDKVPENVNLISAVQTGPLLISSGVPIELKLTTDKPARRMVMADVGSGQSVITLIAVTSENAVLDGPLLDELPAIMEMIWKKEGWLAINMAINLDGGAASAFYTPNFKLQEWSAVGSWWCIK